MRVSQSRDEEAWVALLDELWDREVSPDNGVRWVVCDGDLAIEAGVEIAYPGVRIQRCISHGDPVRMAHPTGMLNRCWRGDILTGERLKGGAS